MIIGKFETFTVAVHSYPWMHSESDMSAQLLLDYLTDILETVDLVGTATAAKLDSKACLWFTFSSEQDATLAKETIAKIFNEGAWLSND